MCTVRPGCGGPHVCMPPAAPHLLSVAGLGSRGDTVLVDRRPGRCKLLAQGLAVYPSPENKAKFEEERRLQLAGDLGGRAQTWTGEMTVNYLKKSRLRVEMRSHTTWELNEEIVARQLLKNVRRMHRVVSWRPPPGNTVWSAQVCEGGERSFMNPKTKRYKHWLSKQPKMTESPAEGDIPSEPPAEGDIPSEPPAEGDIPSEPPAEGDIPSELPPEGGAPPKSNTN
ncbi:hypothetical protein GDO78_020294 [Eleutherodactylus coqui]|uniref:Large ribosomal subunit protein bL9m n=1 Tax=Eleutherodactylus coqui TaxID=57060 RepID=A0A8J6E8T8_ELECQ|nr:hypothetical protein GDO78_020294 [Eleutherodactylus coqui]